MNHYGKTQRRLAGGILLLLAGLVLGLLGLAGPTGRQRYDVTQYGANGGDTKDDSAAIQRCLDRAEGRDGLVTVEIPEGIYYVSQPLEIYSNTELLLEDGAVLVRAGRCRTMLKTAATGEPGYGQQRNILIQGGTWDGNPYGIYPGTQESCCATEIIKLRHGEEITLQDAVIQNNAGAAHLVELLGCRKVTIDRCVFAGHRDTGSGNESYKEAIQLDYCWTDREDGATSPIGDAYPYDNTVCEDITVSNCTFTHYMTGVGQHYNYSQGEEGRCRKIAILGNTFIGMDYAAVRLYTMDDVTISGNRFLSCGTGVLAWWSNALLEGNQFSGSKEWDVKVQGFTGEENAWTDLRMVDNQLTGPVSYGKGALIHS